MATGNHFTPGEPLTGVLSLTTSDIDSATTAINLAATRGIFYISATAPTITDTPDWDRMCWLEPIQWNGEDAYQAWTYSASLGDWVKLVAGLPDEDGFDNNSIPVRALKSTLLEVGMVPVVTNNGGTPLVQWQTFVPTNIPIANITPGSANTLLATNNAGTGTVWTSFATLLASLGKVIPLSSITQSGATTGQSAKWNGANWVPYTPYEVTTPDLNEATWAPASNWLEVWSSALTKTVRKTRTNFFNTLLQDYTAGGISFTTEFMGWTDTITAPARYTVQALYDLIAPTIISSAVAAGAGTYPKKYISPILSLYRANVPPEDIFPPTLLNQYWLHNLGGRPNSFGAVIIRTAANNLYSLASWPLGYSVSSDKVKFAGVLQSPVYLVAADATQLVMVKGTGPVVPGGSFINDYAFNAADADYITLSYGDSDFSIQLYAYL